MQYRVYRLRLSRALLSFRSIGNSPNLAMVYPIHLLQLVTS